MGGLRTRGWRVGVGAAITAAAIGGAPLHIAAAGARIANVGTPAESPSRTLVGAAVSGSAAPLRPQPASGAKVRIPHAPRPFDATKDAAAREAANRAYQRWAAAHPGAAARPAAAGAGAGIVALDKPGVAAADDSPPDPTGAIGPNQYVEFVNHSVAVYKRSLASPPLAQTTEETFTGTTCDSDGQIKWDQQAGRFVYWSLDCPGAANGFSFGWSKTNNPSDLAGGWCKFHFATSGIEDYGKLGTYDNGWVLGSDEYPSISSSLSHAQLFGFPKPLSGDQTCPADLASNQFDLSGLPGLGFAPEPATILASSASGYAVAISIATNPFSNLVLYRIDGTAPSATVTEVGSISVGTFRIPAGVPQPSPAPASDVLDPLDTRLTQAIATTDPATGALGIWTQHTIAGPARGPSVVRWYELEPGRSTPVQTGTISSPGNFVFNGAISPTASGDGAAIDYNVGGSSMLVQLRAQVHLPGAPAGTMSGETTLATSTAVDTDYTCPSVAGKKFHFCRWGDFAGASFDPKVANMVWGSGQIIGTAPNSAHDPQWATQNFSLIADEQPTAAFHATTPTPVSGAPVAFNGTASTDPDGSIVTYTWVWGDGTPNGTGPTPTHSYALAGTVTVRLTVRDSSGLTATAAKKVTIG